MWQEPGHTGKTLVEAIGESLPEILVITAPDGHKDISECHVLGDDVSALMDGLKNSARQYAEIETELLADDASEAFTLAKGLLYSDILVEFEDLLPRLGLTGEDKNAKILYLALVSRLLDKPISVIVKGPSSVGKSHTVVTVLKVFPESAYYDLTGMSERVLAYSDEPVRHRILVIQEASGLSSDFGSYLLRSLLSEGRIRYAFVEKTPKGMKSRMIEREGPTGAILTTTWASLHPENETRMISITGKDDPKQTSDVLMTLAESVNGKGPSIPDLAPWHALQTWLELAGNREVTIPFAEELAKYSNPLAVRMRRDFGAVLSLIRAHAILYQYQRDEDDMGRIVATPDDYSAVYELVIDVVSEGVDATVSETVRETVEAVQNLSEFRGNKPVNLSQLADHMKLHKSAVSRRVSVAKDRGYLVDLEDRRGKPSQLVMGDPLPEDKPVLPSPESLEKNIPLYPPDKTATLQH